MNRSDDLSKQIYDIEELRTERSIFCWKGGFGLVDKLLTI